MDNGTTFTYQYSAKRSKEIEQIRQRYLPQKESKLEELKRLDRTVQTSGVAESLCVGIGGMLVFGLGMCLAMQVIGSGAFFVALGVLLGLCGAVGMLAAYPVHRRVFDQTKEAYRERILALSAELSGEKNEF